MPPVITTGHDQLASLIQMVLAEEGNQSLAAAWRHSTGNNFSARRNEHIEWRARLLRPYTFFLSVWPAVRPRCVIADVN